MTEQERFNMVRMEIEKLRVLRKNVRKKEVKFSAMEKKAKDLKSKEIGTCGYFYKPEYKLSDMYRSLGCGITSKIDSLLTYLEEYDK